MKSFVFPGQGSQKIGMGKDLYDNFQTAKDVFEEVNSVLSQNLSTLMFEGLESELALTENAQPALMAVSVAIIRVLEKDFGFNLKNHAKFISGHSLGEYSALTAINSISLTESAKLLKLRGKAMESANSIAKGSMVAVLGMTDYAKIQDLLKESTLPGEVCVLANDNCIGQVVLSGHCNSVDNVIKNCKDFGARMSIKLNVSGAFHSPLMQPASNKMAEVLSNADIKDVSIPLISNVLAQTVENGQKIKELLIEQIVKPVRWRETMDLMIADNITEIIEVGSGNVLTGLMKKTNVKINRINIQNHLDIENFIKFM